MSATRSALSFGKQIAYACGMMGWGIMINVVSVILVYFYLPPKDSGFTSFISEATVFGFFNLIALITAGGRLVDAFYDPFIAQFSDQSKNPKGRRIPIMRWAILPSILFCVLVFVPISDTVSSGNAIWLSVMLVLFYVATTTYIIPYNALLPELAHDSSAQVKLATWQSAGYVFGIAIASNAFNISGLIQKQYHLSPTLSMQYTTALLAVLGGLAMLVTVTLIKEKNTATANMHPVSMKKAIRSTLTNRNFMYFIVADFSYFTGVTIITSGLMYFVTVLLGLDDSIGNKLMITMVGVSFLFYPITNIAAAKTSKRNIVVFSLSLLAAVFLGVYFLGKPDIDPQVQIYSLIAVAAIPVATLNILPNAIISAIIAEDFSRTGENKEALYFAVRYFFVKMAQTAGIAIFAMLLSYGKDPGDDYGIRLNGLVGFVLCGVAALVFLRFKEKR
jgi:GPH family glycoside/pentoside/hexuronide:cation symporter